MGVKNDLNDDVSFDKRHLLAHTHTRLDCGYNFYVLSWAAKSVSFFMCEILDKLPFWLEQFIRGLSYALHGKQLRNACIKHIFGAWVAHKCVIVFVEYLFCYCCHKEA